MPPPSHNCWVKPVLRTTCISWLHAVKYLYRPCRVCNMLSGTHWDESSWQGCTRARRQCILLLGSSTCIPLSIMHMREELYLTYDTISGWIYLLNKYALKHNNSKHKCAGGQEAFTKSASPFNRWLANQRYYTSPVTFTQQYYTWAILISIFPTASWTTQPACRILVAHTSYDNTI